MGGSSLGRMALEVRRVGAPWAGWLYQLGGWELPGQMALSVRRVGPQ